MATADPTIGPSPLARDQAPSTELADQWRVLTRAATIVVALVIMSTKGHVDRQWVTQNLVLGVVITVVGWRFISWQGHLGGFLAGLATAGLIVFAPKAHRSAFQWGGIAAVIFALLALAAVRVAALA